MVNGNVAIQRKTGKKKTARKGNGRPKPEPEQPYVPNAATAAIAAGMRDAYKAGVRTAAQQVADSYGIPVRVQNKDGSIDTLSPKPDPKQAELDAWSARRAVARRRRAAFEAELAAETDEAAGLAEALGAHIFPSHEYPNNSLLPQVLQSLVDDLEILGDGVREGTLGQSHALDRQLWRLEHRARFGLLVAGDNKDAEKADDKAESEAIDPANCGAVSTERLTQARAILNRELALRIMIERRLRDGEEVTPAVVRHALVFQGTPPAQAEEQAGRLLGEAWDAVRNEVQP